MIGKGKLFFQLRKIKREHKELLRFRKKLEIACSDLALPSLQNYADFNEALWIKRLILLID